MDRDVLILLQRRRVFDEPGYAFQKQPEFGSPRKATAQILSGSHGSHVSDPDVSRKSCRGPTPRTCPYPDVPHVRFCSVLTLPFLCPEVFLRSSGSELALQVPSSLFQRWKV